MIKKEQTRNTSLNARKCEACRVYHWMTQDGRMMFITWPEVSVNGGRFFAKVYPPKIPHKGPRFILYRTYKLPDGGLTWKDVVRWDEIPDWSPKDYQEKIKLYLPFL